MTVQSGSGGSASAWRGAIPPRGVTAVQAQGKAQVSQHLVPPKKQAVDDGAHGTHDYPDVHPQVLSRLDAHGSRLSEHDARIKRLEGAIKAQLGAPDHQKEA